MPRVPIFTVVLIGFCVAVIVFVVMMLRGLGQAERHTNEQAAVAAIDQDRGARLRAIAIKRMNDGYVPDPSTAVERQLEIDTLDIAMQTMGLTLPEASRTMLQYLTLEELKSMPSGL